MSCVTYHLSLMPTAIHSLTRNLHSTGKWVFRNDTDKHTQYSRPLQLRDLTGPEGIFSEINCVCRTALATTGQKESSSIVVKKCMQANTLNVAKKLTRHKSRIAPHSSQSASHYVFAISDNKLLNINMSPGAAGGSGTLQGPFWQ